MQLQKLFKIKILANFIILWVYKCLKIKPRHFYIIEKLYLGYTQEHGMLGSKPSIIPIQKNNDWRTDNSLILNDLIIYRRLTGN